MTNIVGGNTSNLSQPGSSHDGPSSNPLSKNATLDFLSLISVAFEGQKNSNSEAGISDGTDSRLNSAKENLALGLSKGQQLTSQKGEQVSSDDILAYLEGLNSNPDKNKITNGISTLDLLGRLSNSEEERLAELVGPPSALTKAFVSELSAYVEINNSKSDKLSGLQTLDINAQLQNPDALQRQIPDLINSTSFNIDDAYASNFNNLVSLEPASSFKKFPFKSLSDVAFINEQLDQFESVNKVSFLLNSDISDQENLSEKNAIEIKVIQNPDLFSIKVFDLSNNKMKIASDIIDPSSIEIDLNQLEHENILNIGIPDKDLAFIVLNVDLNNHGKFDFSPLPINLSPSDTFQKFYEGTAVSTDAKKASLTENSKILATFKNSILDVDTNINLGSTNEELPSLNRSNSLNLKIEVSLGENLPKINSTSLEEAIQLSQSPSKFPILTNEQARFVAEKLQLSNNITKQDLISNNKIADFILKSRGNFVVDSAVSEIVKREFKLSGNMPAKNNLFMSTADVIGYRQEMVNSLSEKKFVTKEFSFFDNSELVIEKTGTRGEPDLIKGLDLTTVLIPQENKANSVQPATISNRIDQIVPQSQVSTNTVTPQKLPLLDAQFASRMAATLLEQAINSKENFDLILEPESFGKVRVNVSLENLQLDVKLTAENAATLAILRSSEAILQSITEINGLKLAEYNVELSNNNQNNSGSRQQKENNGEKDSTTNESRQELDDKLESSNDDGSHNLNLIA